MQRVCFELRVAPNLDECRRRHGAVLPEMLHALAASGRRNYSLFLRPDGVLIGYYETDSVGRADAHLAEERALGRAHGRPVRRPRRSLRPGRHRARRGLPLEDQLAALETEKDRA